MKARLFCLALLPLLLLNSCGYFWGSSQISNEYRTISVPYIQGDSSGRMTDQLVNQITASGALEYVSCNGDLTLKVCLIKPKDTSIGFNYATGKNYIVPDEGRLTLGARVSVIDTCTGACVVDQFTVFSSLTYDYQSDSSDDNFHDFSLGQFVMHNQAKEAAFFPLHQRLSQKIVDYAVHGWYSDLN